MKTYSVEQMLDILNVVNKINQAEKDEKACDSPFQVGQCWFFRTVTYHLTGRIKEINGHFLKLECAAWIADSGRFMQAINNGTLSEVEPVKVNPVINIESICDAFPWLHALPTEQI